jgi:hypothetical protein
MEKPVISAMPMGVDSISMSEENRIISGIDRPLNFVSRTVRISEVLSIIGQA